MKTKIIIGVILISFCIGLLASCADRRSGPLVVQTYSLRGAVFPVITDPEPIGGLGLISGVVDSITNQNPHREVMLLGTYNMLYGTPEAYVTDGMPLVDIMNLMGYDGLIIGVREWYFGRTILEKQARRASFPFIGANIRDESGARLPFIRGSVVSDDGSFGIIGLSPPQILTQNFPEHIQGIQLIDPVEAVKEEVDVLRLSGVETIMVIAGGFGVYDGISLPSPLFEIAAIPGVDIIETGVQGEMVSGLYQLGDRTESTDPPSDSGEPEENTEPVENQTLSSLIDTLKVGQTAVLGVNNQKITYGAVVGLLDSLEAEYTEIPVNASSVQASQRLEPILSQVKALTQGLLDRPITHLPEALPHNFEKESPLGNFFVDLLREEFDLDVVMINAGGIRGGLPAGDVTLSDLYKAYPFGGNLVFLSLTGEQIIELLEYSLQFIGRPEMGRGFLMVSGLRFEYSRNENQSELFVSSIRVNGESLELDGLYEVAVEKYIFDGGDGYNQFQDWGITPDRTEPRSTLSILNEIIKERGENIGGVDGRIKRR